MQIYRFRDMEKRFWSKVDKRGPDECWPWNGCIKRNGYGAIGNDMAHRVSYKLNVGPITNGMCVMHTCDHPWCVNPSHLKLGTPRDNTQDALKKGRLQNPNVPKGSANHMHKLTENDVLEIRSSVGVPNRQLAIRYDVSVPLIWNIKHGYSWRHLLSAEERDMLDRERRERKVGRSQEFNNRTKLSSQQVMQILLSPDKTPKQLADKYGVSKTTICYIRIGKTWKHINEEFSAEVA